MSQLVSGNIRGLSQSERRKVEKLYSRSVDQNEIVSLELARELYRVAFELRRRVGVLISRSGQIEEVFLGTKDILYLPDLGRYRFGKSRLRRLRLAFSDLSDPKKPPHISSDIYTDLEKLRLDMVISVKMVGHSTKMAYAHLVPIATDSADNGHSAARPVNTEYVDDVASNTLNLGKFLDELEDQLALPSATDHVAGGLKAMLVGVYGTGSRAPEDSMRELSELARTAGIKVAGKVIQNREPDPRTLIGKGKLEELVLRCLRLNAEMLIFDTELRPSQWRAITNSTELKVIDRSMLILDIFAQRAKSSEGRLQVELAQLKYNLPRLVEKDAGLSRLTGGIGARGPGETKLEIGRRRIRERISQLESRISKISEERGLRRKKREEGKIPLASILGYTNVGKSTLFSVLTRSEVFIEDKLFATLDPAQRRVSIGVVNNAAEPEKIYHDAVISDTVGFIQDLPDALKTAFRATLEELYHAELLIHVLDASDPEIRDRKAAVDTILQEMGLSSLPVLMVLNKIDLLAPEEAQLLEHEFAGVLVSALEREGMAKLLEEIGKRLFVKSA